jgi:hypothetical protein
MVPKKRFYYCGCGNICRIGYLQAPSRNGGHRINSSSKEIRVAMIDNQLNNRLNGGAGNGDMGLWRFVDMNMRTK